MSRFRRSKLLVSLCHTEDPEQSINQLAMELEEESSILFPPPTITEIKNNDVFEHTSNVNMSTFTDLTNFVSTISEKSPSVTNQNLITSTSNITVTCLETSNNSETDINATPASSNVILQLNEKTGCFEKIVEKENIIHAVHEDEMFLSETKNRKENQKLRLLGKTYTGHQVVREEEKTKLEKIKKPNRKLREKPCHHGAAQKSDRSYACAAIADETRADIFRYFWQLPTWDAKKAYINGLIQVRKVLRRRKTSKDITKKSLGFDCYLPGLNGIKVRVCKELFLATFDLKKDVLQLWIKSNSTSSLDTTNANSGVNKGRRIDRKSNNQSAVRNLKSESVNKWLACVPKVPSHYCRSNSTRVYVEESFDSFSHMHSVYTAWCQDNNVYAVKRKKFQEILKENKITIFKPRKDQCDTCVGYKEGNIQDNLYTLHVTKKEEAYKAKAEAIQEISENVEVVSMDMQSVLLCPKLLVSEQYYKMKLGVHNFSFYVKNTKDVYLYVWHEGDGGVTANNVTSCIVDFIEQYCSNKKKVILISDGCAYQNKNKILCSALANLSAAKKLIIEQIILEKGHTMMEVDSVHSTLEKKFKAPIFCPSDYVSRMRQCRPTQPYIVNYLDYSFFKNYEEMPGNFSTIRPGRRTGDATVTDIRSLLYQNGEVKYKLRHSDDWETLPQRRTTTREPAAPARLYDSPLKIDSTKFNHLQSLKQYMHRDYHAFFDSLRH